MALPKPFTAIHFSDSELEQFSAINDADIQIARELWIRYAPTMWGGALMDAPAVGTANARIVWDPQNRKYIDTLTNSYVLPLDIRNLAIEPFLSNVKAAMREVSTRLQQRFITLPEWQNEMMRLIKYSHIAAGLIANGGARNNTQTDYAKIAALILFLYLFFQGFASDIESGEQVINGFLLLRSDLYANAGRDVYEEMRRFAMQTYYGAVYERRVLDPQANHCRTEIVEGEEWRGCPELAQLGWRPIGSLPRLMDTPCVSNCHCHFEYARRVNGEPELIDDSAILLPSEILTLVRIGRANA